MCRYKESRPQREKPSLNGYNRKRSSVPTEVWKMPLSRRKQRSCIRQRAKLLDHRAYWFWKTYFAHAMFQFASNQVIADDKELIVFNCADYANNPELLMSHLFGYVRGLYGCRSREDRYYWSSGWDVVARWDPSITARRARNDFYFMDHGTFSRLERRAKSSSECPNRWSDYEDPNSTL